MAISISPNETVTVLRLSGNIGPEEMDALACILMDMVLENKTRVILNFHHVKHIALNAISKLADRNQRFRALGGEIKLVGLIPYVSNLFKLVGAYSQFDVLAYEEEAAARFGK